MNMDLKEYIVEKSSRKQDDGDDFSVVKSLRKYGQRRKADTQVAYLRYKIDNATDKAEKEKYQSQLKFVKSTLYDDEGNTIVGKKAREERMADLVQSGKLSKDDIYSYKDMNDMYKDAKKFASTPEGKEYRKEAKKEVRSEWNGMQDDREKYQRDQTKKDLKDILSGKKQKEEIKKAKKQEKEEVKKKEGSEEEGITSKEEEITTPEGDKRKVTVYTGPRGGRYYYPEGSSKKPEDRVYLDESFEGSLAGWLVERIW